MAEKALGTSEAPAPAPAPDVPHPTVLPKPEDVFEPHILPQYDPAVVQYILETKAGAAVPAGHEVSIEEVRSNPARYAPPWARDVTGWERVDDDVVVSEDGAEIPVKIYRPDPEVFGRGPFGAHLNFHGGGFVFGDLTTESQLCLSMRDGAGVVVVDVNYRHCPETVFGKCFQDAWAALLWTRTSAATLNINPTSISIGGASAGGHIALVLQHLARDHQIPLKLCLATVPATTPGLQYRSPSESPYGSFREFANGPVLPWARIRFFGQQCIPAGARGDEVRAMWPWWWFGPLEADRWDGLCETYVRTAGCDPLRDEGEAYAMRLVAGGNKVSVKRYNGCPHTFAYFGWFARKKEFDADSVAALRVAHGVRWRAAV